MFETPYSSQITHSKWRKSKTCAFIASRLLNSQLIRSFQKLNNLRAEAEAAVERAEAAEAKNKQLELTLLQRDQDITSLNHRLALSDEQLEKAEGKLADAKHAHEEGDTAKSTAENLTRKIQILEEELDNAEKNLKETVEKYVVPCSLSSSRDISFCLRRNQPADRGAFIS